MDSEQRRKRKRVYRPYSRAQYVSVRSLILGLCFLVFLLFLSSDRLPIRTVSFKPVLSASAISLLSSNSIQDSFKLRFKSSFHLKIEDRVLFPDHLLLMVSNKLNQTDTLECVYHEVLNDSDNINEEAARAGGVRILPVISVHEYDRFRWIARCPLPPVNYSDIVYLRHPGDGDVDVAAENDWSLMNNQTVVHSWEKMAYSAVLDGKTVVVFVKGLNLRPHRESDHTLFRCQFGFGHWEKDEGFTFVTEAVAAAQEVVGCLLPRSISKNPDKAQGIRVTVVNVNDRAVGDRKSGVTTLAQIRNSRYYIHGKNRRLSQDYLPMPSAARIHN